jgi:hypothetical protein
MKENRASLGGLRGIMRRRCKPQQSLATAVDRFSTGCVEQCKDSPKTRSNVGDGIGARTMRGVTTAIAMQWAAIMGGRNVERGEPSRAPDAGRAPGAQRRRSRRSIYLNKPPIHWQRVMTRLRSLRRRELAMLVGNVSVGFENRSLKVSYGSVRLKARGEAARL